VIQEHEPTTLQPALPLWMRIGGAVLLGYLLAAFVAGLFLSERLQELGSEDRRRRIDETLALLAPPALRALQSEDVTEFREVARQAAAMEGLRITLIKTDGEVVAESERPLPLSNHADRPEIRAALADGQGEIVRNSTTVGEPFLYVGRRVGPADGPLGVLRLSVPTAVQDRYSTDLSVLILLALAAGLPVLGLVGWYASRRIARPLEDMTAAASRMAAGDFESLPRGTRDDEAGRLAEALRRMGKELSTMLDVSDSDRAELGAILGSMVEGVVALDRRERILRANKGAAGVLDLDEVPPPGTPLSDVVRLPDLSDLVRRALAGEHVKDRDVEFPGPAGRVLNLSASPIRGAAADVTGAVLVIRDVTSLRRLERARLDFVANVSHELRTPVAAVMGALETVQDLGEGEDPAAGRRLIDTAYRNAHRLSSIVNDLLALSAIETEEGRMARAAVPLLRTIRSAASALATESDRNDVEVITPSSELPEVLVHGHEGRLELVWVNLIGNAIKYTADGGHVEVSVTEDAARRLACVAVRDTGSGIPPDAVHRIFERFYRVDKARSRDRGGTGLGLAIVKHIVRAHRGRVEVESVVGTGSTFRVWLPLHSNA
jgi:two-component system phosphate regulon sensor histidine kinase PhoR